MSPESGQQPPEAQSGSDSIAHWSELVTWRCLMGKLQISVEKQLEYTQSSLPLPEEPQAVLTVTM